MKRDFGAPHGSSWWTLGVETVGAEPTRGLGARAGCAGAGPASSTRAPAGAGWFDPGDSSPTRFGYRIQNTSISKNLCIMLVKFRDYIFL